MPLVAGTRLGPHEIIAPLGAGGMGEVYRARDTRLDRTVAIKVLPAHLMANEEFKQRLEREARAISSLNHPHICALYDIGNQDGMDYLVLEYLEGETLSARLAKGPMPPDQVLRYAVQVADALDKAHRKGVTHRDLKPGNIMLTQVGAKLLDFGLAKVTPRGGVVEASMTALPTQEAELTAKGTLLGTFQYISPEQLEGRDADARSDIFAFGAVLYEMATGRKAFEGRSAASLIGNILHTEPPPVSTLQPMSPPALDRIVKRCLAKDPEERWQTARDLMLELKEISLAPAAHSPTPTPQPLSPIPRPFAWIAVTAVLALVTAALGVLYFRRPPAENFPIRFAVPVPEKTSRVSGMSVSPDGRRLAVSMIVDGRRAIWVRSLDSLPLRPLSGTEDGIYPFWSPHGRSLGFGAPGKLKRIDITGGPPQTLCEVSGFAVGTWNREGVIVFSGNPDGLYRVPAAGGVPVPATKIDSSLRERSHIYPQFLPDGRHFLYLAQNAERERSGIYVGSLDTAPDSKDRRPLLATETKAAYAPPRNGGSGHLLFLREATLMAQPFDDKALALQGEPFPVAEQVASLPAIGFAAFGVSPTGVLAYRVGAILGINHMTWFDRNGKRLGPMAPPGEFRDPRLSPDDKRVAVERGESGNRDIWVYDLGRGTTTRLTFHAAEDSSPIWSPDGSRIIFASDRDGGVKLYQKDSTGVGAEELLLKPETRLVGPLTWSLDGKFIIHDVIGDRTRRDLWALPLAGDRKPFPYLQQEFAQWQGQFSPDGNYVAYVSDESQRAEVYVATFPTPSSRWQVSTTGGTDPQWRRDGKELYYLSLDGKLMAIDVKLAPKFEAAAPRLLFEAAAVGSPQQMRNRYAVTRDGQRFLFNLPAEDTTAAPITVVVNWK